MPEMRLSAGSEMKRPKPSDEFAEMRVSQQLDFSRKLNDLRLHFSPETGRCSAGAFGANASGDNSG